MTAWSSGDQVGMKFASLLVCVSSVWKSWSDMIGDREVEDSGICGNGIGGS
jgi:hypothetical protein